MLTNKKEPKILVISNNPFSENYNNGKTLASYFQEFSSENIAQLYFNSSLPNFKHYTNYYQITDSQLFKSIFNYRQNIGQQVYNQNNQLIKKELKVKNIIKDYDFFRICREFLWKSDKWKTDELCNWLDTFSPEVVFLCAGDSGFAYNIAQYVKEKYNTKMIVYITDDYILPRKNKSVFWWVRRNYILRLMRKTLKECDLLYTISEQMKNEYKKIFNIDSNLAINITDSLYDNQKRKSYKDLTFVYTGGLHFKRYETLALLAKSIDYYNNSHENIKLNLKIYSNSTPPKKILKRINIPNASQFCGSLNSKEVRTVLNECDFPVHVESFCSQCIESTKLSISTKIPEYLSLKKPIISIGPSEVASIQYLKDCSFCINDIQEIDNLLPKFIEDRELRKSLSLKASEKFELLHNKNVNLKQMKKDILRIYN